MIIITDLLRAPFNEGAKNTTHSIVAKLCKDKNTTIYSVNGCKEDVDFDVEAVSVNRGFMSVRFLIALRHRVGKEVLYIPESSATLFTITRAKIISFFCKKNVHILALQPRKYGVVWHQIIKYFKPESIITPSSSFANYLNGIGVPSNPIPLGVDGDVFSEFKKEKKSLLRRKYGLPDNKLTLLHVGHIKNSRNLNLLVEIKEACPEIEVVVVGSTYNESDSVLKELLLKKGVVILNRHIDNMAEIYNLADYYVFPVLDSSGAIATPLSVLEAMACNVRVFSTQFGSLPDVFSSDDDMQFITDSSDILKLLKEQPDLERGCSNRGKVERFTWGAISSEIKMIVEGGS